MRRAAASVLLLLSLGATLLAQSTSQPAPAPATQPQPGPAPKAAKAPLPGPGEPGFDPAQFRRQILEQQRAQERQQREQERQQLEQERQQTRDQLQRDRDQRTQQRATLQQAEQIRRNAMAEADAQIRRGEALRNSVAPAAPAAPQTPAVSPKPAPRSTHHLTLPGIDISDGDDDDVNPDGDDKDTPRPAHPILQPAQPAAALDPRGIVSGPMGDRLDLTGSWLFQRGSETSPGSYTSPSLNDTQWIVVDTRQPLWTAGQYNLNEIWYRVHLALPPGTHGLALTLSGIGGSYRVFANGKEIGGKGRMADRGDYLVEGSSTFPIPDALLASGPLVLTIHLFVGSVDRISFTMADGISSKSSVYLGPASLLERDEATYLESHRVEGGAILMLWAILLILALALTFLVPRVPAYPVLVLIAAAHLVGDLLVDYRSLHHLSHRPWLDWPIYLALSASTVAGLTLCRIASGTPQRLWIRLVGIFFGAAILSLWLSSMGVFSFLVYALLRYAAYALVLSADLYLIIRGSRRKIKDAQILLATSCIYAVYLGWWALLRYGHVTLGLPPAVIQRLLDALKPEQVSNFAIAVGLFLLLVVRTLSIVRERAAIATEIGAARTMQQLLLGGSPKITPGFAVETVYLPAGELGGDFFLLSPADDGSLTVLVGDVSGKGLLAAMRVSMIFGILRREPSREPAEILAGLNTALLTQGEMGFTTACCLQIQPSGQYTFANAGHIPPYIMGRELELAPALPLGLAPDQVYDTVAGRLAPNQRMVLLSDGVPEARTAKGELYGFDRLGPLTLLPAQEIASTAQLFGQDDDITVLTIACLPETRGEGAATPPPPSATTLSAAPRPVPAPDPPPPARTPTPPPPMPTV